MLAIKSWTDFPVKLKTKKSKATKTTINTMAVNAIGIPLRFDHTNNGMQIMAMKMERSIVEISELAAFIPAMTIKEAAIVTRTFDAEILFL